MKKICLIFLLFGLSLSTYAQAPPDLIEFANSVDLSRNFHDDSYKTRYEGSPFLFDEWAQGTVYTVGGNQRELTMRYLILENSFLVKNGESVGKLALNNNVSHIELNGHKFIWTTYIAGKNVTQGILEALYEGENGTAFFKQYSIEARAGRDGSGYQQEEKPRLTRKTKFYYRVSGEAIREIPSKKKDFFSVFGDKSGQVESYFKTEDLSMNEEGYVKAFEYYNSL